MERRFLMNEECDPAPITWNFPSFAMKIPKNDPNYKFDQLQSGFFWPNSVEQSDPLDPALGSILSSPAGSNVGSAVNSVGDKLMIREQIGRLGSCCEPGDILTPAYVGGNNESNNYSSCSTPLNSPPKLNLSVENPDIKGNSSVYERNFPVYPRSKLFSSDPEIAKRAAGFSCFAARNGVPGKQISTIREFESQIDEDQERRKSSIEFRTSLSSKKSRKQSSSPTSETAERGDSREVSSLFQQISYCETAMKEKDEVDPNNRKRKSSSKVKSEEAPSGKIAKIEGKNEESNPDDGTKTKKEANEGTKSGEDENQKNAKLPELPKDYIHVRARRGQATDSHSLAERVRREKISERMKFLQDLVPGCNKGTKKAVVLDEIINYVQSLQRQVECLSMKLASVNPRMNLNMAALLSKDISQSSASLRHNADSSSTAFLNIPSETEIQFPVNSLQCRNQQMQMIYVDGYTKDDPQVLSCWEDDLQSLVQMGFGQNLQKNLHC